MEQIFNQKLGFAH